jgi:hypothetical protein
MDHTETDVDDIETETGVNDIETGTGTGTEKDVVDVVKLTQLAYDIISINPDLRSRALNTHTLTGELVENIPEDDIFYLESSGGVWIFSLKELHQYISDPQSGRKNPYTSEPLCQSTIETVLRRYASNTAVIAATISNSDGDGDGDGDTDSAGSWHTIASFSSAQSEQEAAAATAAAAAGNWEITEFLSTVSNLGCYPDINGFNELDWLQIAALVRGMIDEWPDLLTILSDSEKTELINTLEAEEDIDGHSIISFLLKMVTQGDGDDSTRAVIFTTCLSRFLSPEDSIETLLYNLQRQPDSESFNNQVRHIIDHIVRLNTYSLSSVSSVDSLMSTASAAGASGGASASDDSEPGAGTNIG